ncbi:MAG: DinB family protein [Terriglobia bacterium]
MSEVERLHDQLRRAFEGEAWHGPPVREVLAGVTAEQAAQHPLPKAHSIWELVHHIAAWEAIVRRRLLGDAVKDVTTEMDWPPVRETSEAAWKHALAELERGHRELRETVGELREERLSERVPGHEGEYSVYELVQGIVQHDLYHAGQIAILKKGLRG